MYSRVYVEITNICNMHCSFCHGHSRIPRMMTYGEFTYILENLKGKTQYIYYHLMGEPLLHPELPMFLKAASEMGYKSMITTNGTLLSGCGKDIIGSGLHKVNISIHSFENGDDLSFEKYINDITDFADKANKSGIIVVLRLWNKGFDGGLNDVILSRLRSSLEGGWVENTKGIRIREKLFLEYGDRFEWPDINADVCGDQYFCYGLRDHFGILCDGTVVPCCLDSNGIINLGNIFTQDITDILESARSKAIVDGFSSRKASEELCKKCGYAQRFV